MYYEDERTKYQFNKYGFMKSIIFLILIMAIIIYRIIGKIDFISILLLLSVPIVSIILLAKGIRKKRLSISEIINGIITGDERTSNIIDSCGMRAIGFGTTFLFMYCIYGWIRFSAQNIGLELLLFLLVCFDIAIEGRFINKNYVAHTDYGFEQPYYDDDKKKKTIMKRIIKSWIKFAIFFSLLDVISGINLMKQSLSSSITKYIGILAGEMILCLIFAIIDILIMKYINKKVYDRIK